MISKTKFLDNIDAIATEKPSYQLGHDGSDGKCDCIGLIIGAIRRSGEKWTGTHGSNYAARNEMEYLLPINSVNDLSVGEVVYKAAKPGASNYNLPSRYDGHSDRNDYYHVGVVRSVSPLKIVHCTGPGIVYDTKLGKWSHRGWLKKVAGNDMETTDTTEAGNVGGNQMSETVQYYAIVTASNGLPVNFRTAPNANANRVTRCPKVGVGTKVGVISSDGTWSKIIYGEHCGYMMDKFLKNEEDVANSSSSDTDVLKRLKEVEKRLDLAEQRLAKLDGGLG